LFVDQSGFYLLPTVVRTYAPVGQTPILHEHLTRDHLSVISAIIMERKLLMMEQEGAFKRQDVVRFLRDLLGQSPGKLLLIWDGSPIHRGRASKSSSPAGRRRIGLSWSSFLATLQISTPMRESGST
jgi:hypothetical protein